MKHRDDFYQLFSFKNGIGAEIGVQEGHYSYTLLKNSHQKFNKFYCIDPYKPFPKEEYTDYSNKDVTEHIIFFNTAEKQLSEFPCVEFLIEESLNVVNDFPDNHFDFIYIDGNHMFYPVLKDIIAWWPKVKKGGIFAGHDYYIRRNEVDVLEVQYAIDAFVMINNLSLNHGFECSSWYIIK